MLSDGYAFALIYTAMIVGYVVMLVSTIYTGVIFWIWFKRRLVEIADLEEK